MANKPVTINEIAAAEEISCPNCGTAGCWQLIELVTATCRLASFALTDDGKIIFEYTGDTEYHDGRTTGLQCVECQWEIDGTDQEMWLAELYPKPDLDALLALRDRLAPKP